MYTFSMFVPLLGQSPGLLRGRSAPAPHPPSGSHGDQHPVRHIAPTRSPRRANTELCPLPMSEHLSFPLRTGGGVRGFQWAWGLSGDITEHSASHYSNSPNPAPPLRCLQCPTMHQEWTGTPRPVFIFDDFPQCITVTWPQPIMSALLHPQLPTPSPTHFL